MSEVRISTAEASSGVLVLSERDEGQEDLDLNDAMLVGVKRYPLSRNAEAVPLLLLVNAK